MSRTALALAVVLAVLAAVAAAKESKFAVIVSAGPGMGTRFPVLDLAVSGPCTVLDTDTAVLEAGKSASAQFSAASGAKCVLSW